MELFKLVTLLLGLFAFANGLYVPITKNTSAPELVVLSGNETFDYPLSSHTRAKGHIRSLASRALGKVKYEVDIMRGLQKRRPYGDPEYDCDTSIILINATPYRWKRGYIHHYQMERWPKSWPEYINPGDMAAVWAKPGEGLFNWGDSGAEVEYHIEGVSKPMSFMTKFHNKGKGSVDIVFRGQLSTINNAPNSVHELGFHRLPGGSGFVLAGTEGHFISNDPPLGWMQTMLPDLAKIPLREIVLPRSHHAGLWQTKRTIGFGSAMNTQTQTVSLDNQLGNGGIRVLDLRPIRRKEKFLEGHGSKIMGLWHGTLGASLDEMVDTVNEFNRETPGELIIWDVHPTDALNADRKFRTLSKGDRELLYEKFMRLEHRINVTNDEEDISQWPLERFIGNNTSAVIINFDETWREMDDWETFPGGEHGFLTGRNLPLNHHWSNMEDPDKMVEDQIRHFKELRSSRDKPILVSDWLVTQKGLNVVFTDVSLFNMAWPPLRALFNKLWPAVTSESYPNWIAVDNVYGNMHKSLVMAMNHCLVAKKCGELGGKVKLDKGKE